jgi:hypothetical protein
MTWRAVSILGLAIAVLGALVFVWGAAVMILANRSYHGPSEGQHRGEKVAHLSGAVLLVVGFGLQLVSAIRIAH